MISQNLELARFDASRVIIHAFRNHFGMQNYFEMSGNVLGIYSK